MWKEKIFKYAKEKSFKEKRLSRNETTFQKLDQKSNDWEVVFLWKNTSKNIVTIIF